MDKLNTEKTAKSQLNVACWVDMLYDNWEWRIAKYSKVDGYL